MSEEAKKDVKCHYCGQIITVPKDTKIFVCHDCGVVNDVQDTVIAGTEICPCSPPPQWAGWDLPAGSHRDPLGRMWYQTATGQWLLEDAYTKQLALNPKIAQKAMREMGICGVEGYFNTSGLGKKAKKWGYKP